MVQSMDSLPVRLLPANLRPLAYRVLSKKHGLNIKTDALAKLTEAVSLKFGANWKGRDTFEFLEEVARIWKLEDRGLFLDEDGITQVLKLMELQPQRRITPELSDDPSATQLALNWKEYFRVINPPDQPFYAYDRTRKQFYTLNEQPSHLEAAIEMFTQRYLIIADRLSRNEMFQKKSFSSVLLFRETAPTHEISMIKNMLGRDGNTFFLFGLLATDAEGNWILNDASDTVELNLDQTYKNVLTFYGPGMFVIVEGIYSALGGHHGLTSMVGCFYVSNMALPTAERRETSLDNFGHLDFMGINQDAEPDQPVTRVPKEMIKQLVSLEKQYTGHKMIFLGSECHLDDPDVLSALRKFFHKLEADLTQAYETNDLFNDNSERRAPLAIVMTGSFVLTPVVPTTISYGSSSNSQRYKQGFDSLALILEPLTQVRKCKFVLIPGSNDPWQLMWSQGATAVNVVPQKPLSKQVTLRLQRTLKDNLELAWNPVRINYCSQEIVVIKQDYMNKFKRLDIIFANDLERMRAEAEAEDAVPRDQDERIRQAASQGKGTLLPRTVEQARRLVKTVLDQGNLEPFLPTLRVVNARYNHALRLEPMPTLMVMLDALFDQFELLYMGCRVVNLGRLLSMPRELNYGVYYPHLRRFVLEVLHC